MNKSKKFSSAMVMAAAVVAVAGFSSCATKKIDQQVDSQLAKTPPVSGTAELKKDTSNTIATAPGLTDDQRAKLMAIQKSAEAQLDQLREQSLKMRELLVQEVVRTQSYNDNEVNRIKTRLKEVEGKRLTTLFKALDQANEVLGHETQRKQVIDSMMRMDRYDSGFSAAEGR